MPSRSRSPRHFLVFFILKNFLESYGKKTEFEWYVRILWRKMRGSLIKGYENMRFSPQDDAENFFWLPRYLDFNNFKYNLFSSTDCSQSASTRWKWGLMPKISQVWKWYHCVEECFGFSSHQKVLKLNRIKIKLSFLQICKFKNKVLRRSTLKLESLDLIRCNRHLF